MKNRVLIVFTLLAFASGFAVAQTPDWSAQPTYGTIDLAAGFFPDPKTMDITAGGPVDLSNLGYSGYVAKAPDVDLNYESAGGTLYIYVEDADDDTVLLINAPDGEWHFNDDMNGVNPGIEFRNADSGLYDIWIGTFYDDLVDATLAISEIGSGTAGGSQPDWSLQPAYGTISLSAGFADDPRTVSLTAGGTIDLEAMGFYGHVADAPDVDLQYEAGGFGLYIYVSSQSEDTVLLVNDPSGNWHFSDDEIGSRPGISFAKPESGLYDIWVGTFGGGLADAKVAISEMGW